MLEKKVSAITIARRIACSYWLWLIILAPILWGLLPLGYHYIKQDLNIKANPTFIVFMRMLFSCVITLIALICYSCFMRRRVGKLNYDKVFGRFSGKLSWGVSWYFLFALGACYFGARFIEMKLILGFSYEQDEVRNKVCDIQVRHPYLMQGIDIEGVIKDLDSMTNGLDDVKFEITNIYKQAQAEYLARNKKSVLSEDSLSKLENLTNDCVSQVERIRLGECVKEIKKKSVPNNYIAKTATNGLQEFGYFMGLLLTLILGIKYRFVGGILRVIKNRFGRKRKESESQSLFKARLNSLTGTPFSLIGWISWIITLFLIAASGALNLSAREPLYAWDGIGIMLVWAFLVAILTSFANDCKKAGRLTVDYERIGDECKAKYEKVQAVLSCFFMTACMSGVAALIALIVWMLEDGQTFNEAFELSKAFFYDGKHICGGKIFWFLIVVVILCSCVAPVLLLLGAQKHDEHLEKNKLKQYGISGSDWMQIFGGLEPFFVVLIGVFVSWLVNLGCSCLQNVQSSANPFISYCPIWLSVGTVLIIILLRIMEMWAEKDSVLRNRVFTKVRGSSRGIPDRDSGESIEAFKTRINDYFKRKMISENDIIKTVEKRAQDLTWLKLYDKRNSLKDFELKLRAEIIPWENIKSHDAVSAADKDEANVFKIANSFCFVIEGCDKYFTQDDPFTHDVLSAVFDWLQMEQLQPMEQLQKGHYIQIDSFKYLFYDYCTDEKPWKKEKEQEPDGLKDIACRGYTDATPFVLMIEPSKTVCLGDVALGVIKSLNEFLKRIKDAVDRHELSGLVYSVVNEELDKMRDEKNKKMNDTKK